MEEDYKEYTAKEILDYCIQYLRGAEIGKEEKEIGKKLYNAMLQEIEFMIDTD